jgi:uncharacterized protein with PQ loop repeat
MHNLRSIHYVFQKKLLLEPVLSQMNAVHNLKCVHYLPHKKPPLHSIQSQTNRIHDFTLPFLEFHLNIILPHTPRFPNNRLTSRFLTKTLYEFISLRASYVPFVIFTCVRRCLSFVLIFLKIKCTCYRLMKLLVLCKSVNGSAYARSSLFYFLSSRSHVVTA